MTTTGLTTTGLTTTGLTRWRRLSWVTWRQYRTTLIVVFGLFALPAAAMAVTGLDTRAHAAVLYSLGRSSSSPYTWQLTLLGTWLELMPVIAGLLLGAPLLAQEIESGSARFTWTQGAGRGSSLAAKAVLLAVTLAIAAGGVSWEFAWWSRMVTSVVYYHFAAPQFSYFPFSFAGWTVLGFSVGVLAGAITRRTVPALAGTLAGYGVLFYLRGFYQLPNTRLAAFSTPFPFLYSFNSWHEQVQLRVFAALIVLSGLLVAAAGALIWRRSA